MPSGMAHSLSLLHIPNAPLQSPGSASLETYIPIQQGASSTSLSPSPASSGNVAEAKTAPNEFAPVVLTAVAVTSAAAAVTYLTAAAIVVAAAQIALWASMVDYLLGEK